MKRTKKGFTLMEMLIVVAIIAVLIAIAIPVYTSTLNKVKLSVDNANLDNAKNAANVMYLEDALNNKGTTAISDGAKYWYTTDGTFSNAETAPDNAVKGQSSANKDKSIQVTFTADGTEVTAASTFYTAPAKK